MDATQLLAAFRSAGTLTDAQVDECTQAAARGIDVEELLVNRKFASADAIAEAKGRILGLSVAVLTGREIPLDVLQLLSRRTAEQFHAVAFERAGDTVTIGLLDPTDSHAVEAIEFLARERQLQVRYAIITPSSFADALRRYGEGKKEAAAAVAAAAEKFAPKETEAVSAEEAELTTAVEKAPVSKIVSVIIRHAVDGKASDIHIEPHGKETRIRYRIDGILRTSLVLPLTLHGAIVARVKVLASLKLDETRIPQDGRIHLTEGGREIDLRVSTLPLLDQEKVVMRILETSTAILTLKDLGFRDLAITMVERAVHRPHGMVLITGPTGSGKSTTLYAVLNLLNQEGVNITTLEDPVEYYVRGVNQGQINAVVGFTFAAGLRAILRQDPNVIMVGEIRDTETAELAIHAALTGHLLFSTLHTRDVLGIVPRLTDMKVEPFLLASTLVLALAQRLVRKLCSECKEEVPVPPEVEKVIAPVLAGIPKGQVPPEVAQRGIKLWKGRGCPKCGGGGYRGRTVITETLEFNPEFQELVVKGFPADEAKRLAREQGMLTLHEDAFLKALEGVTSYEEVLRITHE